MLNVFNPTSPQQIFCILGPGGDKNKALWQAQVLLLAESGVTPRAARLVYAAQQPRGVSTDPHTGNCLKGHFPGTLLVRVRVLQVQLGIGDVKATLSSRNNQSTETSLLVAANPPLWGPDGDGFTIPQMTCVAGQFPLVHMENGNDYEKWFRQGLGRVIKDGQDLNKSLFAGSSGLILDGKPLLPNANDNGGHTSTNNLPLLLEVEQPPPPDSNGTLVLRLDPDRLSAPEFKPGREELAAYFAGLVQKLNPDIPGKGAKLCWLRIELTDPTRLPDFTWRIDPKKDIPQLIFPPGEWKLSLSDQALRDPRTPTRGALTADPEVVLFGNEFKISGGKPPSEEKGPRAKYVADLASPEPDENLSLLDVALSYDPVQAADRLRAVYELPRPRADDQDVDLNSAGLTGRVSTSDGKIDPPVLWGFTPLADGWAQLPFFNLTEELLIDALPNQSTEPAATSDDQNPVRTSLFRGAALFGTDSVELYDPDEGRMPWNLVLLDADNFAGKWTFKNGELSQVELTLWGPEVTAEGLFQLATEAPTPADALPTLNNWVTGLSALPLRTPEPGDPYPSPFILTFRKLSLQRIEKNEKNGQLRFSFARITAWEWLYEENALKHTGNVDPIDVGGTGSRSVNLSLPLHVWLTALKRSRFPVDRVWGTPANQPVEAASAIAWRRHPSHPSIQVLPLTQSATPANALSASRQLAPFGLPVKEIPWTFSLNDKNLTLSYLVPEDWVFQSNNSDLLPRVTSNVKPSFELRRLPRLGMALLGLPGAALAVQSSNQQNGPSYIPDPSSFLDRFMYRHDLPVLDQPNALSDVPRDNGRDETASSPRALLRKAYAQHWWALENKAVLAETDEAEALLNINNAREIRGLMEPITWPVELSVDVRAFPGSLTFTDRTDTAHSITLQGDDPATDALRGFDGTFKQVGNTLQLCGEGDATVAMVGGSFTARVENRDNNGMLRDQRGLLRGKTTTTSGGNLLTTFLLLDGVSNGPTTPTQTTLFTMKEPVNLAVAGKTWVFWVKDLPASGTGPFKFIRSTTTSRQRRGVNDPGADGRDYGILNGYEWRLSTKDIKHDQSWLPLGPFLFFPLSLESITLTESGEVTEGEFVGRLQLPAWGGKSSSHRSEQELDDRDSAVLVTFQNGSLERLKRASNDPEPSNNSQNIPGETPLPTELASWPLVDNPTDMGAPVLLWNEIKLSENRDSVLLLKGQYKLVFNRQGVIWTVEGQEDLSFPLFETDRKELRVTLMPRSSLNNIGDVEIRSITLALDLYTACHRLAVDWVFRLGEKEGLQVEATVRDELLFVAPTPPTDGQPANPWLHAFLVHQSVKIELDIDELEAANSTPLTLENNSLAFTWSKFRTNRNRLPHQQLLPGFHLAEEEEACSGCAMLTFEIVEIKLGLPSVSIRGGYYDTLFRCTWGSHLLQSQASESGDVSRALPSAEAVFSSSAGRVLAEYHCAHVVNSQKDPWRCELSLSGVLEVKNLISWPAALSLNGTNLSIPAGNEAPWHHWRHTALVVLAEHRPPPKIIVGCDSNDCFLTLEKESVWTLPATVEHQLLCLDAEGNGESRPTITSATGEIRWVAVQEVRVCPPKALHTYLATIADGHVINPAVQLASWTGWEFKPSFERLHGLHSQLMLEALKVVDASGAHPTTIPFEHSELNQLGQALLIEATVPLFLRAQTTGNRPGPWLFSAPGGAVVAGMSGLADFSHNPDPTKKEQWLFLSVPFLGRLQALDRDRQQGLFATDPVMALAAVSSQAEDPLILRALTNRSGSKKDQIEIKLFDTGLYRMFRRLDASSVAEAWLRLFWVREQQPSPSGPELLRGVTAAAPSDAAVVSARPQALAPLFDSRRVSLPPTQLPKSPLKPSNGLVWTPESIALLQPAFKLDEMLNQKPYPFLAFPLALLGSEFLDDQRENKTLRFPSATLLPVPPPKDTESSWFQPVSLVLSPFSSVGYRPWLVSENENASERERHEKVLLASAELMVFNPSREKLEIASEQSFNQTDGDIKDGSLLKWAADTKARLAADSPTALLRVRELRQAPKSANGELAGIEVTFRFLTVPGEVTLAMARRTMAIRTTSERLRHRQGQFGGTALPDLAAVRDIDFELAPPLVRGLQPFRFHQRPADGQPWPWGVAGLRLATAYRQSQGADVGSVEWSENRVWWQSAGMGVQFALPKDRQLLPKLFRSSAIPGFAPTWPRTPLPTQAQLELILNNPLPSSSTSEIKTLKMKDWQTVLPGYRTMLATGLRPGAPYSLRETIATQWFSKKGPQASVVSGSVPVQHRAPRPVPLPSSEGSRQDIALRTWGSWFDLKSEDPKRLNRTVAVSSSPYAEFSLLLAAGRESGMRFVLRSPTSTEIDSDRTITEEQKSALKVRAAVSSTGGGLAQNWSGELFCRRESPSNNDSGIWVTSMTVVVGGVTFPFQKITGFDSEPVPGGFEVFTPEDRETLLRQFAGLKAGEVVAVQLTAFHSGAGTISGYFQSATFALRVDTTPFPSPFAPRYLTWEDPEYNRRLASLVARDEEIITTKGDGDKEVSFTLALVADRREYNSTGKITYAFVGPNDPDVLNVLINPLFSFSILSPEGSKCLKSLPAVINTLPAPDYCDLLNICKDHKFEPGHILRISLDYKIRGDDKDKKLELDLSIVSSLVNPVPEAAYAVLRRTGETDDCARFAWAPEPSCIELVNPDDLLGQIVRRRAIFALTDTVNRSLATVTTYAVQKITTAGATHFPPIDQSAT